MVKTALDDFAPPPSALLLGWRLIGAKPEEGWIKVGFEAKPDFCNPAGFIQGGFLAAMLDETMGPAMLILTKGVTFTVTIDLHIHYLGAARPGPLIGEAKVVQAGKTIAFMEGSLTDGDGRLIARGHTSARLVPAAKAVARQEER